MGTRCIMDIQGKYREVVRLCHHYDGYPEDIVPFTREVELWMKSILSPSEYHLAEDPLYVAPAFSQYELNCLKQMNAEAETKGQKWGNGLSPLGSFVSVPDCRFLDFDLWFDIEFYYLLRVSETPWQVTAYEVVRDYALMFEKQQMPRFIGLARYEVFDEPLPDLLKCKICGDKYPREMMEKDHIIPKSKGGKGKRFNRRYVCTNCHSYLHRCDKRTFATLK